MNNLSYFIYKDHYILAKYLCSICEVSYIAESINTEHFLSSCNLFEVKIFVEKELSYHLATCLPKSQNKQFRNFVDIIFYDESFIHLDWTFLSIFNAPAVL